MKGLIVLGLALLLVTVGCVSTQPSNSTDGAMMEKTGDVVEPKDDTMMEKNGDLMEGKEDTMMEEKEEGAMMEKGIAYTPFTQSAYNQAKAEGKTIFLEFYANWCPTCKAQYPALVDGLSKISSENLVAFQVNYKDSETDADESELAKQFNITYQHTHVVTNANGETLLKSQENWSTDDVINKLGGFA